MATRQFDAMKEKALEIVLADGRFRICRGNGRRRIAIYDEPLTCLEVKPVLKWAGGKRWLAPASRLLVPTEFSGRYYEPFFGGGSFYFSLRPMHATLSDKNEELISAYVALSRDHKKIISLLKTYPYDKEFYYRMRASRPRTPHTRAARLIFLNRSCWNGLFRVNRAGIFNVPFGDFTNPTICDASRLEQAADALRTATLRHGDFASILRTARKGDLVYLDPPYITGHKNNGFHKYNAQLFSWGDQERLAKYAKRLSARGVNVLVTNADHPDVNALYAGFYRYRVHRDSLIASQEKFRHTVTESLFSSYPLCGVG